MEKKSKLSILLNGIIKENPTFILVLGTCPTIAVTTQAFNGLGMGLAATAVLICSNVFVSLLRKIIPDTVRIPCFIVVIATFVTIIEFAMKAYVPSLYATLGLFIPLIVVNCIILGRAEMYARKNTVFDSMLDGLGMGLGFLLAMILFAGVRSRIENCPAPKAMQGLPITLVAASIVSLAFFGFSGVISGLLGM